MNKFILHLEGAIVLCVCIYGYLYFGFNWWVFIVLLFAPDLAMVGYLVSSKIGAIIYNIFHTYVISLSVFLIGIMLKENMLISIGLIWTAHIGMDRMFGFGLKYATEFQDTHLNRV